MSQLPLLLFPSPTTVSRARLGGGGSRVVSPSASEQRRRLENKFQQLSQSIASLQPTIQGLEPEQVIVFETVGKNIEKLAEAASRIVGLEWLAELNLDDYHPDDVFSMAGKPDALLSHRLYSLMTNQKSMTQLLSLWSSWTAKPKKRAMNGFGPFKDLFIHLNDIRRWGPQDRIDQTMIVEDWKERLQSYPDKPSRFEAELWFRKNARLRNAAISQLNRLVIAQGGRSLAQATVESIHYHGALLEMPSNSVLEILNQIQNGQFNDLLQCEGVMFFRPVGQARFPNPRTNETTPLTSPPSIGNPLPKGNPRAALLDGLPLASHLGLDGRLLIDDPDEIGLKYEAGQQSHGTAMASLISRGDLEENNTPLKTPLYCPPDFRSL